MQMNISNSNLSQNFISNKKLQHLPRFFNVFLIEKNQKESQDSKKTITKFKNSFINIMITNRFTNCPLNSTTQDKKRQPKAQHTWIVQTHNVVLEVGSSSRNHDFAVQMLTQFNADLTGLQCQFSCGNNYKS